MTADVEIAVRKINDYLNKSNNKSNCLVIKDQNGNTFTFKKGCHVEAWSFCIFKEEK